MSLFGSIRMAGNSLRANEIALQVVGQNIANANTPGYIREEYQLAPAPSQRMGDLLLGMGVRVVSVTQKLDSYLEERLNASVSDLASSEAQEQVYAQLEGVIGELNDTDLSTSLDSFFSSINDILNQPGDVSVRNLAVLQGQTLTEDINRMANRVATIRANVNDKVEGLASSINQLVEEIRTLNIDISQMECGEVSASDAAGLRDQRLVAVESLAKIINIRVTEQESGGVAIYSGGDYLVFEGSSREVEVVLDSNRGLTVADLHLAETDSPLGLESGEMHGLLAARDDILGGFLDTLDAFAGTLAFEFNKVFSGGQGLHGYDSLTGHFEVDDPTEALNQAGLDFTPETGSFQLLVHSNLTGLTETTDISVDLNGLGSDTTLDDLATAIDNINGVSATTVSGALRITSDSADQVFAFGDDTSGALAALGINTLFTGSDAFSLGMNAELMTDPAKFAASRGGIGVDVDNLTVDADGNQRLANFLDRELDSQNGNTLSVLYDRMVDGVAQGSTIAQAVADGSRVFETALRGQKTALSGVNLDEEAIEMLSLQRSFQASARYISALNELFGVLVNL